MNLVSRNQQQYGPRAFTLIELLVVITIVALLLTILVPSLARAKQQSQGIVCRSNIRQLVLANVTYAVENNGEFILAAPDIFTGQNLVRWHGARDDLDSFFQMERSLLYAYIADGDAKECPRKTQFRTGDPWQWDFEQGCGGYGYNMTYIGSRIWEDYTAQNCARATRESEVGSPQSTLMFSDAAMVKLENEAPYYLEYSFAEPYYFVVNGRPDESWGRPSPSVHFRHNRQSNVGWCDGHVDARRIALDDTVNAYGVCSYDSLIGWFDPPDNSLFDLK